MADKWFLQNNAPLFVELRAEKIASCSVIIDLHKSSIILQQ